MSHGPMCGCGCCQNGTEDGAGDGGIDLVDNSGGTAAPTYQIDASNLDELLDYLNESGSKWSDDGSGVALLIGFPQIVGEIPATLQHYAQFLNQFHVAFVPFDEARIDATMLALAQWSDIANIDFQLAPEPEDADLVFFGRAFTAGGAYSSGVSETNGSAIRMNVDADVVWNEMAPGGFGFHALLHEIGHSLGLSHPREYDVGTGATYENSALYVQDSNMYSIMSYFESHETGFASNGVANNLLTIRSHDMYAIQQMHGANWGTRNTDTVYGYNASGLGGAIYYDFDALPEDFGPQLTIWDGGGNDTLDLSGDTSDVLIDLEPGSFSSTHGMVNNLSLAYDPGGGPGTMYIENAIGGSGDDTLLGNALGNVLSGLGGHDLIYGFDGDDTLNGGSGDDTLIGGYGTDLFDGGSGTDTVSFAYSNGSWDIVLGAGNTAGTATAGGAVETLLRIENVIGADGDDDITGTSIANVLHGGDGDDTLRGMNGADVLEGGAGDDSLLGGNGADTLRGGIDGNEAQSGDDTLKGDSGDDLILGGDGDDLIWGGSDEDTLYGGDGEDTIYGHDGDDTIQGGKGADYINAGSGDDLILQVSFAAGGQQDGNDTIFGGSGNDTIEAGYGHDRIDGGAGDDSIIGGHGNDTIFASAGSDFVNGSSGWDEYNFASSTEDWHVDLLNQTATSDAKPTDTLVSIEVIRAGAGHDTLSGDHAVNMIAAGAGNDAVYGSGGDDILLGEAGNDTLTGGTGNDFLNGGAGADTARYVGGSSGVVVDLALHNIAQDTGGAGVDTLVSIERLIGSNFGDVLFGNSATNWLTGNGGADFLFGREGDDLLLGGSGDDVLEGGPGDDVLHGGEGNDTASYFFAPSGVIVSLAANGSQNTLGAGNDVLSDIENLIGSFHNDFLIGDEHANRLTGGAGNDVLSGGNGSDSLFGGDGDDVLIGGLGNDLIDGGAGIDWAYFNNAPGGVEVDLRAGAQSTGLGSDQIQNVENLLGSLADDDLRGDDEDNEIRGSNGDDTIFGGGGNDTLQGDGGNDHIYVGLTEPYKAPGDFIPVQPQGGDDDFDLLGEWSGGGTGPLLAKVAAPTRGASSAAEPLSIAGGPPTAQRASPAFGDESAGPAGSGADVVRFTSGWGNDEIFGFTAGIDKLDFTLIAAIEDVIDLLIANTVDGALISFGSNSALLHGVYQADLSDNDFLV